MYLTSRLIDSFLNMGDFYFNSTVKDMQPFTSYKRNNDYIVEVKTLGINPEDISVTLKDGILEIAGETNNPYSENSFNTKINFSVAESLLKQIKNIKYKSQNGLTYITLQMKEDNFSDIKIERE